MEKPEGTRRQWWDHLTTEREKKLPMWINPATNLPPTNYFLFTSKKFKNGVYYNPYFTIDNPDP